MAKDVNIKVKLSTQEAQAKIKGLKKEQDKAAKKVKERKKKAKKKEKKKGLVKRVKGFRSKVKKGLGKVFFLIAVLNKLFEGFKALAINLQKSKIPLLNRLGGDMAKMSNVVENLITKIAVVEGSIDALGASKKLARVGLGANKEELTKAYTRKRTLQLEVARRESALNSADYLALLNQTLGRGGN